MSYFINEHVKKLIVIDIERYYIEYSNGVKIWYLNGQRHREDKPAVISGNYQVWYFNGQRHREDGPALINGNYQEWWLHGIRYDEETYDKKLKELK